MFSCLIVCGLYFVVVATCLPGFSLLFSALFKSSFKSFGFFSFGGTKGGVEGVTEVYMCFLIVWFFIYLLV